MGGEERKKRTAGERARGGEVRLPHSKFLDPPLVQTDVRHSGKGTGRITLNC